MLSPPPPSWASATLALAFLAALVFIARSCSRWTNPSAVSAWLAGRWAPAVAGLITTVAVRYVWGSFDEPGVVHDERAYLLQAAIFASGHWTAPSPPLPAFFEQMHVFVEPAVFAKYPPGHALMLVPGVWLGLPGVMPALLSGFSGALVFAIARRLANQWIALLTWWMWTSAWANLYWAASYFSENTSGAVWLLGVWAAIRWIDTQRTAFLTVAAGALAWGFEARPLTLLALAVPLVLVVAQRLRGSSSIVATLAVPAIVAATILMLGPIWNQKTVGDWRLNPYSYYSEVYFPFDKPGFGIDPSPPLKTPPELADMGAWSRDVHRSYVPSAVPAALAMRFIALLFWCAEGWRMALGALILAAMIHGDRIERLGLATVGILLIAYLSFAHPSMWTLYYVEIVPILYFLCAQQIGRLLHAFNGGGSPANWPVPVANAALAAALLLVPLGTFDIIRTHTAIDIRNSFHRAARAAIESGTPSNAIVFVRYGAGHNPHLALTGNSPNPASRGRWLVYDRGTEENHRLMALAPGMTAFVFDAAGFDIEPLAPAGAVHRAVSRR